MTEILNYTIVTNNPKVIKQFSEKYKIIEAQDIYEVMSKTRDLIHTGYSLETHPLSGSVKPVQTPYKSIILSKKGTDLDVDSLLIWEKARDKVAMFSEHHTDRMYPEVILEDYQEIDFSLVSSADKSLNGEKQL